MEKFQNPPRRGCGCNLQIRDPGVDLTAFSSRFCVILRPFDGLMVVSNVEPLRSGLMVGKLSRTFANQPIKKTGRVGSGLEWSWLIVGGNGVQILDPVNPNIQFPDLRNFFGRSGANPSVR